MPIIRETFGQTLNPAMSNQVLPLLHLQIQVSLLSLTWWKALWILRWKVFTVTPVNYCLIDKNVPTFEYERICPFSFLGQRSYYFTAPPGALCADWSFPHIRQVGLCRTVLLGTNNNYGGTTRRPDYPNGCYLERHRPLGFLNTHAGSRTFSGMQWCTLRKTGKR